MAGTAVPRRLAERVRWRAAEVIERRQESATAATLMLSVPGWTGHRAGQHLDIRLTAEDGYSTERSYSLASAPARELIEVTVQRLPDGEVSPYLVDELKAGDVIEVRGPVGGWFVWRPEQTEPILLVAGGSGLVPLMSMIRARDAARTRTPFRLLYSVRDPASLLYAAELRRGSPGLDIAYIYTRATPDSWPRRASRLARDDLARHGWPAVFDPTCYICGPTGFVERAAADLVSLGHAPERIRTERFGPGGG